MRVLIIYAHPSEASFTQQVLFQFKKGLVICTAGHSNEVLEATEIAQSMRRIMLNDRLGDRFGQK